MLIIVTIPARCLSTIKIFVQEMNINVLNLLEQRTKKLWSYKQVCNCGWISVLDMKL